MAQDMSQDVTLSGLELEAVRRLAAVRAYVDDPGRWSVYDGRRDQLLAIIDGAGPPPASPTSWSGTLTGTRE